MGLILSLVKGQPPGTQGHAQIVARLLQNTMYPARSLAGILPSLGVGWSAVPRVRKGPGVRPTLHSGRQS